MVAVKRRLLGLATGAGCSLGGLLAVSPCAGSGCAACFGCAGAGVGLALLLVARQLAGGTTDGSAAAAKPGNQGV